VIRIAIAAVLGIAVVAEAQPNRPASEWALADISARVTQRTGPNPRSCGSWFAVPAQERSTLPHRLNASIACGRQAVADGAAFWFVVGGHGLDSWVAEGLLAPAHGPMERYSYDSDPGGSGRVSPRALFGSRRCIGAHVYRYPSGSLTLECLNDPWRLAVHAVVVILSGVSLGLGALLARSSWVKASLAVTVIGAVMVATVIGTLAQLGGLRLDLALPAVACLLALLGVVVRAVRRPAKLAA
jgi:hypothetical protein